MRLRKNCHTSEHAVLSHFNASLAAERHPQLQECQRLLPLLIQREEIIGDQTIQVFAPSQNSLIPANFTISTYSHRQL